MCVFNVITLIHRWFQLLASGLLQVLTSDDNLDLEYVWVFLYHAVFCTPFVRLYRTWQPVTLQELIIFYIEFYYLQSVMPTNNGKMVTFTLQAYRISSEADVLPQLRGAICT